MLRCSYKEMCELIDSPLHYTFPAMITAVTTPGWHRSPRCKDDPTACAYTLQAISTVLGMWTPAQCWAESQPITFDGGNLTVPFVWPMC